MRFERSQPRERTLPRSGPDAAHATAGRDHLGNLRATMATGSTARATARIDLLALTVATVLLRIPALVADRHLTFDDGVFGASAVAMRAGGLPFRDVFSSQGPLFLPLVWVADLLGFRTLNAPRLLSVLAGVLLVGATYVAGRLVTDRAGALLAAGLVCTSASILWVTGPLAADGVALAFATTTIAFTIRWRDDDLGGRARCGWGSASAPRSR